MFQSGQNQAEIIPTHFDQMMETSTQLDNVLDPWAYKDFMGGTSENNHK